MKAKTKIYYIGERYMPYLNHPNFGKHYLDEDDMSFTLPTPYANILLEKNPSMFSKKRDNFAWYEEKFKGQGGFAKLTKYAKSRGLDVKDKKKEDLIKELLELDKK